MRRGEKGQLSGKSKASLAVGDTKAYFAYAVVRVCLCVCVCVFFLFCGGGKGKQKDNRPTAGVPRKGRLCPFDLLPDSAETVCPSKALATKKLSLLPDAKVWPSRVGPWLPHSLSSWTLNFLGRPF